MGPKVDVERNEKRNRLQHQGQKWLKHKVQVPPTETLGTTD
jgi:hypothetical protein